MENNEFNGLNKYLFFFCCDGNMEIIGLSKNTTITESIELSTKRHSLVGNLDQCFSVGMSRFIKHVFNFMYRT